jgi:hypothetical protein
MVEVCKVVPWSRLSIVRKRYKCGAIRPSFAPTARPARSRWLDPLPLATIETTASTRQSFRTGRPPLRVTIRRTGHIPGRNTMKNPLDSLWGTIICGLVLTAILYYVVKSIPL